MMTDLTVLEHDELIYIASIIPLNEFKKHCEKFPKQFQALIPGFRAKSLNEKQKVDLICVEVAKGKGFCHDFVVKSLDKIFDEIKQHYEKLCKTKSPANAWLMTISHSYFADNHKLLGKLMPELLPSITFDEVYEASRDIILEQENLLSDYDKEKKHHDKELKDAKANITNKEKQLKAKEVSISDLKEENENLKKSLDEIKRALLQNENDYRELCDKSEKYIAENDGLKDEIKNRAKEYADLSNTYDENRHQCEELQQKLDKTKEEKAQLAQEYAQKLQEVQHSTQSVADLSRQFNTDDFNMQNVLDRNSECIRPQMIGQFSDMLDDVLEQAGIEEGRGLLVNHLINTLFLGKPIVASRKTADILISCLTNIYDKKPTRVVFDDSLNLNDIIRAIDNGGRIIYLDNFIGNYPETYLIPYFDCYKDKIIIISAAYNAMFKYVSNDFLQYISYINLDRYETSQEIEPIAEDIKEDRFSINKAQNTNARERFEVLMNDLNFSLEVINAKMNNIYNHNDVNGILLYEIVPYLVDVVGNNPFHNCPNLVNYCNYSEVQLINRWFKK